MHEQKGKNVQTMQIFASELSKFEFDQKDSNVLIAGDDIVGIQLAEVDSTDIRSLVGAQSEPTPVTVKKGSRWNFRDERSLVESGNGGTFAFLVSAI